MVTVHITHASCNMDQLRNCLQIIVKFQLAGGNYAGEFYTWTEVLDTRVHGYHEQAEISRLFVGKFLTGPYYTSVV